MGAFSGTLRSNEIFAGLFNMIISQQTFSNNIGGLSSSLVDRARVDGSLYGDTKLYYSADVLKSTPWVQDSVNAVNVLAVERPADPACQAIYLDQFRQIGLTVDNYLSKRAWGTEGAFSQFQSVMLAWINDTKKVYDVTLYNTYIGTTISTEGNQDIDIPLDSSDIGTGEEGNRMEAMAIGEAIANVFSDMSDVSREYNDNGFLRAFDPEDMVVVWNSAFHNKIRKVDLPTIFHNEGIVDKFDEFVINKRYFGDIDDSSNDTVPVNNKTYRSMIETDYTVGADTTHVFPGDLLPDGATYTSGDVYIENPKVICKIMHKDSVPFMSAFEVATSFYNPKNLSENHYLTWGHNTLEYLENYPFITISKQ